MAVGTFHMWKCSFKSFTYEICVWHFFSHVSKRRGSYVKIIFRSDHVKLLFRARNWNSSHGLRLGSSPSLKSPRDRAREVPLRGALDLVASRLGLRRDGLDPSLTWTEHFHMWNHMTNFRKKASATVCGVVPEAIETLRFTTATATNTINHWKELSNYNIWII